MSLYLGKQPLDITVAKIGTGVQCATGTVVIDDDDKATFPRLDFTPTLIALWQMSTMDLKADAEERGDEWEDDFVRYVQEGVMLFAIYHNGEWCVQATDSHSNGTYISGESWDGAREKCVQVRDGIYTYKLNYRGSNVAFAGETFNYAIYGE